MKQLRVYIIAAFLLLLIVCVLKFKQQNSQHVFPASSNREAVVSNPQTNVSKEDGLKATKEAAIPSYVIETLNYILKYDKAPKGYVGGRIYFNRNKVLPQKDASQRNIQYREWDVHPKQPGKNRGAERLVTGSDLSAYFTKDHYNNFIKINL
ncbi:MAG: ribonuclease [Saprospiraceae bacterium]|nr:ribonuclease [Saprospiraceae bacterium]MBK8296656.1 ribonuclease [Saprospiraceae bacterium]